MSSNVLPADIETSSEGYAARFSGAIGGWLLKVQGEIVLNYLAKLKGSSLSLLDVGGGHGQIIESILQSPLRSKFNLTVLGSTQECAGRLRGRIASGECQFRAGDLLKLPMEDKSFDVVTSFRFLSHCPQWQQHIAELCRIARKAVILDYPTHQSINFLSPLMFHLKKGVEGNTRTYKLFSHLEVGHALKISGFTRIERSGQFFWPMVLHRMIGTPPVSSALEYLPRVLGLTKFVGSPVILMAQRE